MVLLRSVKVLENPKWLFYGIAKKDARLYCSIVPKLYFMENNEGKHVEWERYGDVR